MDFVQLLKEADEIVKSKPTFKRFISGTPLENDIAVWMAEFAIENIEQLRTTITEKDARIAQLEEALKVVAPFLCQLRDTGPQWDRYQSKPLVEAINKINEVIGS